MNKIQERIQALRTEVRRHDRLYDAGCPIISDSAYDAIYAELVDLEKAHPEYDDEESPTQKIELKPVEGLEKVLHEKPLLSLEKTTTSEGLAKFIQKTDTDLFLVQEKLDGITISLHYERGKLVDAVTRGSNGVEGERVIHTVRTIKNIPKHIDYLDSLKLRAEIIVPYVEFEKINVDGKYSNPRNLASGTVRQLDPKIAAQRGLKAIVFDVIQGPTQVLDSTQIEAVKKLGFETVETYACRSISDIEKIIQSYADEKRLSLPHMIDGLVVKVNDLCLREALGMTSKYPKWAIAYKFKSLDETTTLKAIEWSVGKSGQVTPVAHLEPVEIDSVCISKATLHNYANIKTKDIRVGDKVVVERANDVIPQVVKSLSELRKGTELVVEWPSQCPACGSETLFDGENLYCTGSSCLPQLEGKIKHFVSRDALNVDGLGEKTVEEFIAKGFITSIADVFELQKHRFEICRLDGFGEKKFAKLMKGLEMAKKRDLHHFIYGLSIKLIGQRASKDLAAYFKTMEALLEEAADSFAFKRKLLSIPNFGPTMADSMLTFFADEQNILLIRKLMANGLSTQVFQNENKETNSLISNKTFVVTGDVTHFENRKALQAKLENLGAKVSGSVSTKTDYLINNDKNSKSSKNTKAKALGIPILSEEDLLVMLSQSVTQDGDKEDIQPTPQNKDSSRELGQLSIF